MPKTALLDPYRIAAGALSPAAALLAMMVSFKTADKFYDNRLSKKLDKDISA